MEGLGKCLFIVLMLVPLEKLGHQMPLETQQPLNQKSQGLFPLEQLTDTQFVFLLPSKEEIEQRLEKLARVHYKPPKKTKDKASIFIFSFTISNSCSVMISLT